jgi:hypothetical protein
MKRVFHYVQKEAQKTLYSYATLIYLRKGVLII